MGPKRTWVRIDADLSDHLDDLSAVEFRAFVTAITKAKWTHPTPGVFPSELHLAADLRRHGMAKAIPRLLATGRLIKHESGAIEVAGWSEWQAPLTGAERTAEYRERMAPASRMASRIPNEARHGPRHLEGEIEKEDPLRHTPAVVPMDPDDIPPSSKVVRTDGGWTAVGDVPVALAARRPSGGEQPQRDKDPDGQSE